MRRTMLIVTAALLAASVFQPPAFADDKSDADARAALALAKAKANAPAIAAAARAIPYADAVKVAAREGKPIFVAVAQADCKGICGELRPAMVTCHEAKFAGSDKARWILAIPSKESPGGFIQLEWAVKPSADDVKKEAAKYGKLKGKVGQLEDAGALLSLVALGLVNETDAAELVEYIQAGPGGVVCVDGVCRPVGYVAMPVGSGPNTAYAASGDETGFAARFPRVASGRGRIRAFLAKLLHRPVQAPMVAGSFVQPAAAIEMDPAGARIVGGPLGDVIERVAVHRTLREALRNGTLTPEQRAGANKILGISNRHHFELAVSAAEVELAKLPVTVSGGSGGRVVGKLGDGAILKLLIDNLPQIIAAILEVLKALHVADISPTPFLPYASAVDCNPAWSMAA